MDALRAALYQRALLAKLGVEDQTPVPEPTIPTRQIFVPLVVGGTPCGRVELDLAELMLAYLKEMCAWDAHASAQSRLLAARIVSKAAVDSFTRKVPSICYYLALTQLGHLWVERFGGRLMEQGAGIDLTGPVRTAVEAFANAGRFCAVCGVWFKRGRPHSRVTCSRRCEATYDKSCYRGRDRTKHADSGRRARWAKKYTRFYESVTAALKASPLDAFPTPDELWSALVEGRVEAKALQEWLEAAGERAISAVYGAIQFGNRSRSKRGRAKPRKSIH